MEHFLETYDYIVYDHLLQNTTQTTQEATFKETSMCLKSAI